MDTVLAVTTLALQRLLNPLDPALQLVLIGPESTFLTSIFRHVSDELHHLVAALVQPALGRKPIALARFARDDPGVILLEEVFTRFVAHAEELGEG